jgi:hypothetical protein
MMSRGRISAEHVSHDDVGRTTDRPAGTRVITTSRKLPRASAGARANAAAATFTGSSGIGRCREPL